MKIQMNNLIGICIGLTFGSIIVSIISKDATCLKYGLGAWMVPLAFWADSKIKK